MYLKGLLHNRREVKWRRELGKAGKWEGRGEKVEERLGNQKLWRVYDCLQSGIMRVSIAK